MLSKFFQLVEKALFLRDRLLNRYALSLQFAAAVLTFLISMALGAPVYAAAWLACFGFLVPQYLLLFAPLVVVVAILAFVGILLRWCITING